MSIFEYLTVAVSIVLALGLSKLVSSIPYVFDRRKRDWLHSFSQLLHTGNCTGVVEHSGIRDVCRSSAKQNARRSNHRRSGVSRLSRPIAVA